MTREKLALRPIVILEGKYDQIKLEALVDTVIVKTDGFGIYRDKEKQKMLRSLAAEYGAVIATDSDAAGFQIRHFLQSLLKDCTLYHLYIPDLYGKEKRKAAPSKEGKLGLEGISLPVLEQALRESGALEESVPERNEPPVTAADLFELGLSGGVGSREKRKAFARSLGLPERIGTNALLSVINKRMTKGELIRRAEESGGAE